MSKTAQAEADPHRCRVLERSAAVQQEFLTISAVWLVFRDQLELAGRVCQSLALVTRPED